MAVVVNKQSEPRYRGKHSGPVAPAPARSSALLPARGSDRAGRGSDEFQLRIQQSPQERFRELLAEGLVGSRRAPRGSGATIAPPPAAELEAFRKRDGAGELVVWKNENRVASGGAVVRTGLPFRIDADETGLHAPGLHVSGREVLSSADDQEPFGRHRQQIENSDPTRDGFDQVQALWTGGFVLALLRKLGVDTDLLQKSSRHSGVMRMLVNAMDFFDAKFIPEQNELWFGAGEEKLHLGSDSDIVAHEIAHYILDKINPEMRQGDGLSIHEGFADALSALAFGDAEISEDFGAIDGEKCLRDVSKFQALNDGEKDPHVRGLAYGGFIWELRNQLAPMVGDPTVASELALGVAVDHAFYYTHTNIEPKDFVANMLRAASARLAGRIDDSSMTKLLDGMESEAKRRNLVPEDFRREALTPFEPEVVDTLNGQLSGDVALNPPRGRQIARLVQRLADRPDVAFQAVSEQQSGSLHKVVLQAHVVDEGRREALPVEDGYVSVLVERGRVVEAGGKGLKLPEHFEIDPIAIDTALVERLKQAVVSLPENRFGMRDLTRRFLLSNLDTIFDPANMQVAEVVFGGKRAVRFSTQIGGFIFEPATGAVTPTRLMFA